MQRLNRRRAVTSVMLATATAIVLAACGGQSHAGASTSSGGTSASGSSGYGGYGSSPSSSSTSSSSSTTGSAGSGATIRLAHTSAGSIVVDSRGLTLYMFTADRSGSDHCVTVSGCAAAWPPLTVTGHPSAGDGLKASLLGTIKLPGGQRQVTYAGHPLYRYAGDSSPASTGYIGATSFGGTWLGVGAGGQAVR